MGSCLRLSLAFRLKPTLRLSRKPRMVSMGYLIARGFRLQAEG